MYRSTPPSPAAVRPARRAALGTLTVAAVAAAALAAGAPATALAQASTGTDYPSRTIRFVVPYASGGPLDQAARVLAEQMRATLGQPVIVENKPGAGGNIGADIIAKAAPDGYSIVMGAVATHAINPYLFKKMPYDANRDFTPITRVALVPNVLVVTPAWAEREKVDSVASLIRSGQLKALAVTTPERTEAQPDLPTVAESGVPGFDISTWFGIFAPAGLPAPILDKLYQAALSALKSPAMIATLDRMGASPAPMDPQAFADFIKAEQRKYEIVVRQSGATVD